MSKPDKREPQRRDPKPEEPWNPTMGPKPGEKRPYRHRAEDALNTVHIMPDDETMAVEALHELTTLIADEQSSPHGDSASLKRTVRRYRKICGDI